MTKLTFLSVVKTLADDWPPESKEVRDQYIEALSQFDKKLAELMTEQIRATAAVSEYARERLEKGAPK